MKLLRIIGLLLSTAVATHAAEDKSIFDTIGPPPPPNPREAAPFVVGLELGINSLGSIVGGHLSWYPFQQVAIDLGGGWSQAGMRGGLGARYFLSKKFSSPFVGVAYMRSGGVDSADLTTGEQDAPTYDVRIENLQFLNAVAGYEIRRPDGLVVTMTTGWSFALTPEKERYIKSWGDLTSDEQDQLDRATGSGPVVSVMVGYGF